MLIVLINATIYQYIVVPTINVGPKYVHVTFKLILNCVSLRFIIIYMSVFCDKKDSLKMHKKSIS